MHSSYHLWSTLAGVPGISNVLPEWQRLLGADFVMASSLFRPTDYRVSSFFCPSPGGNGCPRRVVDYGDGEIIAVCNDEEQGCDNIILRPEDIVVHELDRHKLSTMIAQALDIQPAFSPLEGFHQTFLVGEIKPGGSQRFPVFLTMPLKADALRGITARLLAKVREPFLLLIFTKNLLDLDMADLLIRNKSRFMTLEDILVWDVSSRGFIGKRPANELLAEFMEKAAPELANPESMNYFPTPSGADWAHFMFEFIADEVMLVRCKGVHQPRRIEPEHLGMKNRITGKPTDQWILLKIIALSGGHLSWKNKGANRKNEKQKHLLSKKLRHFFKIDQDPIPWKRQEKAWETRFILRKYQPPPDDRTEAKTTLFEEEFSNLS